jgi:hypothetical protein
MTSGKIALVFARPLQLVPAHDVFLKRGKEKDPSIGKKNSSLRFVSLQIRFVPFISPPNQPPIQITTKEKEG